MSSGKWPYICKTNTCSAHCEAVHFPAVSSCGFTAVAQTDVQLAVGGRFVISPAESRGEEQNGSKPSGILCRVTGGLSGGWCVTRSICIPVPLGAGAVSGTLFRPWVQTAVPPAHGSTYPFFSSSASSGPPVSAIYADQDHVRLARNLKDKRSGICNAAFLIAAHPLRSFPHQGRAE